MKHRVQRRIRNTRFPVKPVASPALPLQHVLEFADDHERDDGTLPEDIARGIRYDRTVYAYSAIYMRLNT